VVFKKSLRAEIEHKGSQTFPDGTSSGFIERDDLMSSVALWYQTEPHKPWPALPAGPDRLPFRDVALVVGWKALPQARHSDHPVSEQKISGATDGKQLWFKPNDDKGWLEIPFHIEKETTSDLTLRIVKSWDYGKYRILLDGKAVTTLDLFDPNTKISEESLNRQTLTAGDHILRFECTGHNNASKGYLLGFDSLQARTPSYVRPADKSLKDLQAK